MSKDLRGETIYIYGKNAVLAALQNNVQCIERLFLENGREFDKEYGNEVFKIIKKNSLKKESFVNSDLSRELQNANHQGILAKVFVGQLTINFEDFIENLEIDSNTCILILGELQDVQNVGSIIRSAAAFGVSGILIPGHNQAQINGTVVKISSGTAFSIPLVKIGNINNTIEKLKEKRFWIYGLDTAGSQSIYEEKYTEATCFIVGNEGEGLRQKTTEACDMLLSIPISASVESLNAAVSTAVTLYEWRKQKLSNK